MLFLVNPPKRKQAKKRRVATRKAATRKGVKRPSAKQIAARQKFVERVRAGAFRARTGRTALQARALSEDETKPRRKSGGSMARRKKSRRGVRRKSPGVVTLMRRNVPGKRRRRRSLVTHRRRHGVRRNPPMGRGVIGQLGGAAVDAAVILVGKGVTNRVASMVPIGDPNSKPITATKQIAVGLVLSMVTKKIAPRFANQVLVGGLLAPMETLLAGVPVIGPAIAPQVTSGSTGTGAYLPWGGSSTGMGSYIAWPKGNAGLSGDVRDHSRLGEYDDKNPGIGIDFNDESGSGAY